MKAEIVNIDEIHEVIIAFANGDFSKRLSLTSDQEERNIIVTGINMLGEELREKTVSRDYFSSIYNAIPVLVIILDLKGQIIDVNNVALDSLGYEKNYILGKYLSDFLNTILPIELDSFIWDNIFNTQQFESEMIGEQHTIPVSCSISRIRDNDGKIQSILFIASDITERLQHRKNILKATAKGQEKERKRLAYDLHDSLGQELNGVMMYMNALENMSPDSTIYLSTLQETKKLLHTAINSVRQISFNLMPNILLKETLGNCIIEMINRVNAIDKKKIIYYIDNSNLNLKDKNDEVLIFRIVQEFINNSIKHSNASIIEVNIKVSGENGKLLSIQLSDNGIGFNVEKEIDNNKLSSIQTRLEALQAQYTFTSSKNNGTNLNFFINE